MRFLPLISLITICLSTVMATAQEKPLVLASASMIHDMAENIGGDLFRYDMIVPIGGDPHIYEPNPRDAQKCNNADIILMNGLTFEGWLNKLVQNSGTQANVVIVTKGVAAIRSLQYANATDPHAWMDASNGLIYAQNIRDAMIALTPNAAETIRANYQVYKDQIQLADSYISQKIRSIPEDRRILITSHDAFQYFGRRYGLRLEAMMGVSTDADVQTSDIQRLNRVIDSTEVPAVFIESTINPKMLEQIASDKHIAIGGKLFADSLSDEDGPAATYLGMLRYNADTIYEGLTMERSHDHEEGDTNYLWLWALLIAPVVLALILFIIRSFK
jgi:ABC-type Zn uptake system ZnuABC Zn-binding protein ZnuA